MPIIHIHHRYAEGNVASLLQKICEEVSSAASIPPDKVWALWHPVDPSLAWRPDWIGDQKGGPIVRIFCRRSHSLERVKSIVAAVRSILAAGLGCEVSTVFVQVIRVDDEEVFSA